MSGSMDEAYLSSYSALDTMSSYIRNTHERERDIEGERDIQTEEKREQQREKEKDTKIQEEREINREK